MRALIILTIFSLAVTSCHKEEISNKYEPINLDLKSQALVESSNQFGFDLFKSTIKNSEEFQNIMISPLSVSQALGMTWNGASGATRDEMTNMLGFDIANAGELNEANQSIRQALLSADRKVDMNIANSIWYRQGYSVNPEFIKTNEDFYNAVVESLDFSQGEESKRIINQWVSDQTKGRIPEIVKGISDDHVMFLINAVYFKGKWKYKFQKDDTGDEKFYLENGTSITTKTMKQSADLMHFSADDCSGIAMPYGNGHFEMIVILPNEGIDVSSIVGSLDDQKWSDYLNSFTEKGVEVWLPRFTFECKQKLNEPLKALGMKTAFTSRADLSKIGPGKLLISKVQHNTFVEVNEEGSEAAAATSVEVELTSIGGGGLPLLFKVDRPFLFAIREKDTGAILFMGQVYNPVN